MPGAGNYIAGGATGAGVGAAFGGPVGAGIGAGIGILGAGFGLFGDDSAAKALQKKQEQMAEEAKKRQAESARTRMNALGQQMLAFNPQNQMMAQMFGPEAAFSPQQFAAMGADPGATSRAKFDEAKSTYEAEMSRHAAAGEKVSLAGRKRAAEALGMTPEVVRRMEEDEERRRKIEQQMTPLGRGPAPIQMSAPQASRRY